MADLRTRLAAWYLGRPVHREATFWAGQVLDAATDLRLVVIDPEDREQVERLLTLYLTEYDGMDSKPQKGEVDSMQAALRIFVAPPKPEEPQGLGAVVEDARGDHWVRVETGAWRRDGYTFRTFDHIYDLGPVRVLAGGWSE